MNRETLNRVIRVGLIVLAGWVGTDCVQAENAAAVAEVLKLKQGGVSDETIVAFIQSRNVAYDLTADNILALRDKGLSPAVLNAMLASGTSRPATLATPVAISTAPASAPGGGTAGAVSTAPSVPSAPVAPPAPVYTPAPAPPFTNPDVAYFYQELSPYGRWILAEDNQWYWQPAIAVTTPSWRPYWDKGHWVWTDHGWYWVSDYPWGWAVFHYGRWRLHPVHGWLWLPDRVWGPAWVVWRTGGEYCGWAPLPPGAVFDTVKASFIFHGKHVAMGFDFGLGLTHFSFCLTRELGAPLRTRLRRESEVRAIFERSTVVSDYAVSRTGTGSEARVRIMNRGIDPARIKMVKGRGFETFSIRDLEAPVPRRMHERLNAKARTLEVYRPRLGGHH